jgi:hypothetical protein
VENEARGVRGEPEGVLISWKEVGAFFGVSARTAQKWEQCSGLPVHRMPGQKGRIWADPVELRAWRNSTVPAGGNGRWKSYAGWGVAFLILAAATVAAALQRRGPPPPGAPADYRIEGSLLIVTDDANREVFRKSFPGFWEHTYADRAKPRVWLADLDAQPGREVLFAWWPRNPSLEGTRLICYSADGRELWRFTPGGKVRDARTEFSGTYLIEDVAAFGSPPDVRILVTSHNELHYPNQLAALDGSGRLMGEYWHSGHLPRLLVTDLDHDGTPEAIAAGVNNSYNAATLIALPFPQGRSASREPAGDYHQLQGLEAAREKARFLFPRTCISRRLNEFNHAVYLGILEDGRLRVKVWESLANPGAHIHYTFGPSLSLLASEWDVQLLNLHRSLRAEGKLDHDLSDKETAGPVKLLDITPR